MKKILQFFLLWIAVASANAQITGITTYDLRDSILTDSTKYYSAITVNDDNQFTIYPGKDGYIAYHGASYGMDVKEGNSISFKLSTYATVSFCESVYGNEGYWVFSDESGTKLDSMSVIAESDLTESTFYYTGTPQTITVTCTSSQAYLSYVKITNSEGASTLEDGQVQVWDFGAQVFGDDTLALLSVDKINGLYSDSIKVVSSGYTFPDFSVDELTWEGNEGSDRLRTSNTDLIRYDEQVGSEYYTGRVYANGTTDGSTRYLNIDLLEDDEVSIVALSQNGSGVLNFIHDTQLDTVNLSKTATEYKFVAKTDGIYKIYDSADKLSFYRVCRKNANYVTVSGSINTDEADGIPDNFAIIFTNEAGKVDTATITNGIYSVILPSGYSYEISLVDAYGYMITSGTTIEVTDNTTNNLIIKAIDLITMSGSIDGLADDIVNLSLTFTSTDESSVYIPEVSINTDDATYSIELERNNTYSITADGVNDYILVDTTVTPSVDITGSTLNFEAKATYAVTITSDDLTESQLSQMSVTFSNLDEDGYDYEFSSIDNVYLRNGTYSVTCSGLDSFAIEQSLTSNLVVDSAALSKAISFNDVTDWDFTSTETISNATAYKGLLFDGSVSVRGSDMYAASGATIKIPVSANDKVIISTYYAADYSVGDVAYSNASGSTSTIQTDEYNCGDEDDTLTITANGGSYFTDIQIVDVVEFKETVYVGENKDYKTINEALDAISKMDRGVDTKRVTIVIDPGNYEEMLVVDQDSITLTNASSTPSIALTNNGIGIDKNTTVRITSYYGCGYNYYSMDEDQKWHEDVLAVNKENGYASYVNVGDGTTNGSYWNATVVIEADGFEANNIIFENSFNQYISDKESKDIVVANDEVPTTTPRSTTAGDTSVQEKEFVERAAAFAIASGDKTFLNNCRIVGHQDSFYGTKGIRVGVYKGVIMGGTDYIFGGMDVVFYQSDLALTTSDDSNDVAYITAAQQDSGRGYLMYECNIVSATPGTDISSSYSTSKPGYFGRPWKAASSEVVFYKTNIAAYASGESLIEEAGWLSSLGGESPYMIECGSVEAATGVDNSSSRASWAKVLDDDATTFTGYDGETVEITPYNFTKGEDGWDPFAIYETEGGGTDITTPSESAVKVYAYKNNVVVTNVTSATMVKVYNLSGQIVKSLEINDSSTFTLPQGYYIVRVDDETGTKAVKVVTHY